MLVSALYSYPLKSGGAISHQQAELTLSGLAGDRSYMVVDANGKFITARTHPKLLLVSARFDLGELVLKASGKAPLRTAGLSGQVAKVEIWKEDIEALDCGEQAASWLSDYLEQPVRLVAAHQAGQRWAKKLDQVPVNFPDRHPLLIVSEASMQAVEQALGQELDILQFRPNIVISGGEAFQEEGWDQIKVGKQKIQLTKPCGRCAMIALKPDTAEFLKKREPFRYLSKTRRTEKGDILFGMLGYPLNEGSLSIGDKVKLLAEKKKRPDFVE